MSVDTLLKKRLMLFFEITVHRLDMNYLQVSADIWLQTVGRISDLYTYLIEEVCFLIVLFIPSRGNQFNVLFYNGGVLFYFHDHL